MTIDVAWSGDTEPLTDAERFEQMLRDKDDIIQGLYAENTSLKERLEQATDGVKHWRRIAAEHGAET